MIHYSESHRLWWPDSNRLDDVDIKDAVRRQSRARAAIGLCRWRRTAIQAGGHVGLYPLELAKAFRQVVTFEPGPATFAALEKNVAHLRNVQAYQCVLSDSWGTRQFLVKENPAASCIDATAALTVGAVSVDGLGCKHVDLIMLDVEGHEATVLRGAENVIRRCRPIIQVEMLPRAQDEILAVLRNLNYRYIKKVGGDWIFKHA